MRIKTGEKSKIAHFWGQSSLGVRNIIPMY